MKCKLKLLYTFIGNVAESRFIWVHKEENDDELGDLEENFRDQPPIVSSSGLFIDNLVPSTDFPDCRIFGVYFWGPVSIPIIIGGWVLQSLYSLVRILTLVSHLYFSGDFVQIHRFRLDISVTFRDAVDAAGAINFVIANHKSLFLQTSHCHQRPARYCPSRSACACSSRNQWVTRDVGQTTRTDSVDCITVV